MNVLGQCHSEDLAATAVAQSEPESVLTSIARSDEELRLGGGTLLRPTAQATGAMPSSAWHSRPPPTVNSRPELVARFVE